MAGVVKRLRRFCPYCGAIIHPDRRACSAHKDLPRLDPATSKVVTSPTVTSDELGCDTPLAERASAGEEKLSRSARSAGSEAAGHNA
jgi:hypothetical protein